MKKSLLALAVLGAFAGVASAQSSVTLNGTMDLNLRYVKNGGFNQKTMGTDGINSSQLVFRGIEDLGGGLQAGFVLNSGINPDTGTANGQFWNRRSTVSLIGGFGELRLGRDYTPTFWNQTLFDPFGTNGIGTMLSVYPNAFGQGSNATTRVRADNTINYFLPSSMGAINGHVMIAPNEGAAATGNKYAGGRLGFNAGPIAAGFSAGQTTVAAAAGDTKLKMWNFAASYDFGVAKPNFVIARSELGTRKNTTVQFGVVAPMGQGELRASYNRADNAGGSASGAGFNDADDYNMFAIGYVYNLSKRTALYGTVASLSNKGASVQTVGALGPAGIKAGEKSTGYEFGLRHFF
jgi:predicted porin